MVTLVYQSLFQELFKGLHILFLHDFGQDSQSISLIHFVFRLSSILGKHVDDYKDFILTDFQFL